MNTIPLRYTHMLTLMVPAISIGGTFAFGKIFESHTQEVPQTVAQVQEVIVTDPAKLETIAQGREIFEHRCARCHGDDARGHGDEDNGPNLHGLRISNARIATVIRRGIKGEMPSFERKHSAPEIASVVVYLRTLR